VQQELLENFLLNDIVGYFGRATLDESHSVSFPSSPPISLLDLRGTGRLSVVPF